ncbi:hypothetical protein KUCAC02_024405, partial [Chaenocephalus aceratus]
MPRLKSSRRSQASKLRVAGTRVGHQQPGSARFAPAGGTGGRHRVQKWPISSLTGRQHKLVVPPESPDKEFVLLVGASHLRSIVDGIVKMPREDAVCVMAPSNNLTSSRTITEAGVDFGKLLATAMSRWPNVFALDFVPRLTVDPDYQDMMRQEFRRVAARMGVKYTPIAEYFPVKDLDLWSRDGVTEPTPSPVVHRRSPPARRVTPRVIVKGEVAKSPQPDPSKWTVIGQGRKRSQHDEPEQSIDALQPAGTVQQEELEESYFPLTPVWFSSAMLVEMDKISPSHLPGPDECTPPQSKTAKESKDGAEAEGFCLQEDPGNATGGGSAHGCGGDITATYQYRDSCCGAAGLEPSPGVEPLASVEPSMSVELSPSNEPSLGVMVDVDDNGWRTGEAHKMNVKPKNLCRLVEQTSVFGRKWNVNMGLPVYGEFNCLKGM